jgi:hypothetical protein
VLPRSEPIEVVKDLERRCVPGLAIRCLSAAAAGASARWLTADGLTGAASPSAASDCRSIRDTEVHERIAELETCGGLRCGDVGIDIAHRRLSQNDRTEKCRTA